jgi:hypothetical protein
LIESLRAEKGDHAQKIAIHLRDTLTANAMISQEEEAKRSLVLLPLIHPKDLTVMIEGLAAIFTVERGEETTSQTGEHQSSIRTVRNKLT